MKKRKPNLRNGGILILALVSLFLLSVLFYSVLLNPNSLFSSNLSGRVGYMSLEQEFGLLLSDVEDEDSGVDSNMADKGELERKIIIHSNEPYFYGRGKNGGKCFKAIRARTRWQLLPLTVFVNPANSKSLSESFVLSSVEEALAEWEAGAGVYLFERVIIDKLANWDSSAPDGRNEISFGFFPDSRVVAATVVWGNFRGKDREIMEFDILFNITHSWGDAISDRSVIDFLSVATHEIGHGLGLADIYKKNCKEVTMYGYTDYGETRKRTLHKQDIKGIRKLYKHLQEGGDNG